MQAAYEAGEVRVVSDIMDSISGAKKFSSIQPKRLVQKDAAGVVLTDREFNSTDEMLEEWTSKMRARFATRAGEENRKTETLDSVGTIPDPRFAKLDRDTFEEACRLVKPFKAAGSDQIKGAVWKYSVVAREALFIIASEIWIREEFPDLLAEILHVMIFKGKGSQNDFQGYRPIGLFNIATKIITVCTLLLMKDDLVKVKPAWQFGFTAGKGTGQAIAIWQWIKEMIVGRGDQAICLFLDFEDAFTSISHGYLFHAMQKAGIAHKLIKITKALYNVAKGRVRTKGTEGETVLSPPYPIDNGVIQGDPPAPNLFLIGLHILIDEIGLLASGFLSPPLRIHTLGYADDLARYFTAHGIDPG